MDTAEHMYTKCSQLARYNSVSSAESLADMFYEIGRNMLEKQNCGMASRWFERAHDVLGQQHLERLSAEAGELRLSIMQSLGLPLSPHMFLVLRRNQFKLV